MKKYYSTLLDRFFSGDNLNGNPNTKVIKTILELAFDILHQEGYADKGGGPFYILDEMNEYIDPSKIINPTIQEQYKQYYQIFNDNIMSRIEEKTTWQDFLNIVVKVYQGGSSLNIFELFKNITGEITYAKMYKNNIEHVNMLKMVGLGRYTEDSFFYSPIFNFEKNDMNYQIPNIILLEDLENLEFNMLDFTEFVKALKPSGVLFLILNMLDLLGYQNVLKTKVDSTWVRAGIYQLFARYNDYGVMPNRYLENIHILSEITNVTIMESVPRFNSEGYYGNEIITEGYSGTIQGFSAKVVWSDGWPDNSGNEFPIAGDVLTTTGDNIIYGG